MAARAVETPRTSEGRVDYDVGWQLWSDTVRYYPSAVHRRRVIANWLRPLSPRSILDAGCGTGSLLSFLRERMPNALYAGVDQAAAQMAQNQRHLAWARFLPLDLAAGHLEERFDAVVCSEVLEHIEDDEAALKNLVAMTGRYLLLTVPTGHRYPIETGFGHLRHYRLEAIAERIEAHGLRVVRAEAWGFPFMNLFKWAANLNPDATLKGFGSGSWSLPKKALGGALTGLFYFSLPARGPQLFVLAERR
jgi:SAM-dependent methyltransferase